MSASGGERKRLTVLFADVKNSTTLIDHDDPEVAMQRLHPALDCMRSAVERYGGIVNRSQGDGVMALFGAPNPHEDHAVRACLAALQMQDAFARLGDPDLQIRVGLHTGEVIVQALTNTLYQTIDAAGVSVHLASRLEQMAEAGGVLLTGDTFAETKEFVKARSLGQQTVRGISGSIEVFELLGVRHAPASELFRSRPRLSPLIGRDSASESLAAQLESVRAGRGMIVGVSGEAGMGKSRLCFEFAESCRKAGIRVFEARALAHGRSTPLQPVLELVRAFLEIKPGEPPATTRERIAGSLRDLPGAAEMLLLTLDFVGLADASQAKPKLDLASRKTRLIELLLDLIARERASVILIEDLHWMDGASGEFVEALAHAVRDRPALLLLNFRSGFTAPWMQQPHYRPIDLQPLQGAAADGLLRDLLGEDPSLAAVCRNVAERAQGNPFFMEELVHSLIERGELEGERGAYRFAGSVEKAPLPSTVEAVLAARIDRLEDEARQILQCAAVIGREVPLAILERVSDGQPGELAQGLSQLDKADLIHELPTQEQRRRYAFRHPLIQEVAYRSLLSARRKKLHGLVAQAVEVVFTERAGEHSGLLAYHLEKAGESLKAAQASMRAAMWIGAKDSGEAFGSWKKVLALLAAAPSTPLTDNLRMMAGGQVMNFGWREGMPAAEARQYFDDANRLALAAGNMRASALITAAYGRILAASGSADEYVAKIEEAEALVSGGNDTSLQVTLKATLCHGLRLAGRLPLALQSNIEAMSRVHEVGVRDRRLLGFDIELWLAVMRGQVLVLLGRCDEARPYLDRLLDIDPSRRGALTHHVAHVAYVDLAWAERDAALAAEHAQHALALADESGNPYVRVYAQASSGLAQLTAQQFDAAALTLSDTLKFARERNAGLEIEARILADLANAYRLGGAFEDARRSAVEAIAVASARLARVPECFARALAADVIWTLDRNIDAAAAELMQARALMMQTGAAIYAPLLREVEQRLGAAAPWRAANAARVDELPDALLSAALGQAAAAARTHTTG